MKFSARAILVPIGFFLVGSIVCLCLLEISMRTAAYCYNHAHHKDTTNAVNKTAPVAVACFGDSFTEGGHAPYKEIYPSQLQEMFNAAGENVRVTNYGVCESNSTQLYRKLVQVTKTEHIDYLILLTGATNRFNFTGYNDSPAAYFIKGLLVARLAHVFWIYVKDYEARQFAHHASSPAPSDGELFRLYDVDILGFKRDYTQGQFPLIDAILQKHNIVVDSFGLFTAQQLLDAFNELLTMPNLSQILHNEKGLSTVRLHTESKDTININRDRLVNVYPHAVVALRPFFFESIGLEKPVLTTSDGNRPFLFNFLELEGSMSIDTTQPQILQQSLIREKFVAISKVIHQARFSDALLQLRQLVATDAKDPRMYAAMGECYEGMGDFSSAEQMYRSLIPLSLEHGNLVLGKFYVRRGNDVMAERCFRQTLNHNPQDGYRELGMFYQDRHRFSDAENAFKHAAIYVPRSANINLMNLYADSGRLEEAETRYTDLLDNRPDTDLAQFAIYYYAQHGRYADTIRCLIQAIDKGVHDMTPLCFLTKIFPLQSTYSASDVLKVMDRAVAREPLLAKEPTFLSYRKYFKNSRAFEKKRDEWLTNDLESIALLCREKGIPLIVMNYPIPYSPINKILFSFAHRNEFPFINLALTFSALIDQYGMSKHFMPDHGHCNMEGNRIIANRAFRLLQALRTPYPKKK